MRAPLASFLPYASLQGHSGKPENAKELLEYLCSSSSRRDQLRVASFRAGFTPQSVDQHGASTYHFSTLGPFCPGLNEM